MIRVVLSLLLLEVCVGQVNNEHSNHWAPFEKPLSSVDESSRRVVRDVGEHKTFGKLGNYISTVIFCDPPTLPDSIHIESASDKNDDFSILFKDVTFSKPSSAFALLYRIDLDASVVELVLRLGRARISGTYSLTPNTAYDPFEANLYVELLYKHYVPYHIDDIGKAVFGKIENPHLHHKKVKSSYANAPSALAKNEKSYLSPKLLEAIVEKIRDEVSAKVNLEDVGHQIKSEMAFRVRSRIADRLKKAIDAAFADVHFNSFNIFYHDKTNFQRIIENYEVTVPTFVLRDVETFTVHDMKVSFVEENVHAKGVFRIAKPLAILRILYRNRNDPLAANHTVKGEYIITESFYEFEMIAKPETGTVEVGNIGVHTSGATLAPSQGLYGDERDLIIRHLVPYVKTYYPDNGYFAFAHYIEGLVAEGRIAHEVFK